MVSTYISRPNQAVRAGGGCLQSRGLSSPVGWAWRWHCQAAGQRGQTEPKPWCRGGSISGPGIDFCGWLGLVAHQEVDSRIRFALTKRRDVGAPSRAELKTGSVEFGSEGAMRARRGRAAARLLRMVDSSGDAVAARREGFDGRRLKGGRLMRRRGLSKPVMAGFGRPSVDTRV